MRRIPLLFCIATVLSTLAACATNPLTGAITRATNLGGAALKNDYKQANLVGVVVWDEGPVQGYPRMERNAMYMQGFTPGAAELGYRAVPIYIRESDNFTHTFVTAAIVPDSMPLLPESSIVEFRNTTMFDNVVNFDKTKEGNVVLQVLCWGGSDVGPERLLECAKKRSPWKGGVGVKKSFPSGLSGNPYAQSIADYGLTFTRRYDDQGNVLPGAPPIPQRPNSHDPFPLVSPAARR